MAADEIESLCMRKGMTDTTVWYGYRARLTEQGFQGGDGTNRYVMEKAYLQPDLACCWLLLLCCCCPPPPPFFMSERICVGLWSWCPTSFDVDLQSQADQRPIKYNTPGLQSSDTAPRTHIC